MGTCFETFLGTCASMFFPRVHGGFWPGFHTGLNALALVAASYPQVFICQWLECTMIWVGIQMNVIVLFSLSPRSHHQWTYTITLKVLLNNLPIFHFVARFYIACWPNMAFGIEYYLWISNWLKLLRWSAPWNPWPSHSIYPVWFLWTVLPFFPSCFVCVCVVF